MHGKEERIWGQLLSLLNNLFAKLFHNALDTSSNAPVSQRGSSKQRYGAWFWAASYYVHCRPRTTDAQNFREAISK